MKIINIAVLSSATAAGLTSELKDFAADGWQPQGGVACSFCVGINGNIYTTYCQTMVLFEVDDEKTSKS